MLQLRDLLMQAVTFLKKSNQKTFVTLARAGTTGFAPEL
jgi:hypothetical protein